MRLRRRPTSPRITCAEEALAAWVAPSETRTGETQGKNAEKDWGKEEYRGVFPGSDPYCVIIIHEKWRNCGDLTQLVFKRM